MHVPLTTKLYEYYFFISSPDDHVQRTCFDGNGTIDAVSPRARIQKKKKPKKTKKQKPLLMPFPRGNAGIGPPSIKTSNRSSIVYASDGEAIDDKTEGMPPMQRERERESSNTRGCLPGPQGPNKVHFSRERVWGKKKKRET